LTLTATARGQSEREFTGAINNTLKIRMKLARSGNALSGSYLYERVGKSLRIRGEVDDDSQFRLTETDERGRQTGIFEGKFVTKDWLEGTWSPSADKKAMPFSATAVNGEDVPATDAGDRLSGRYRRVDARGRFDRHEAEVSIFPLKSGRVRVVGYSSWVGNIETGNVNSGNVDGLFDVRGDRLNYTGANADDACRFAITFGASSLTVSGDNGECGGHNVIFDGKYRKVGPPKAL
jgi:hypothetical protein